MRDDRDSPKDLAQEIGKRKPFDMPAEEAHLNLIRTHAWLTEQSAGLFKRHGLSDSQYNVLRIVRGHGKPVATRRIAEQMVARDPDVTRLIDRLEQAGLVARERCGDDRRVVWVSITAAGSDVLRKLDGPLRALHRSTLGQLGRNRLKDLSRLLFRLPHPESRDS